MKTKYGTRAAPLAWRGSLLDQIPKLKRGEAYVWQQSHMRGYIYFAVYSATTGRLKRIVAGCRVWESFEEAFAHYHEKRSEANFEWTADFDWTDEGLRVGTSVVDLNKYAIRAEARAILVDLKWEYISAFVELTGKQPPIIFLE